MTSEKEKLLPCPFCGSKELPSLCTWGYDSKYGVRCFHKKGVIGGDGAVVMTAKYDTKEEAIAAWNHRPSASIDEAVEKVLEHTGVSCTNCNVERVRCGKCEAEARANVEFILGNLLTKQEQPTTAVGVEEAREEWEIVVASEKLAGNVVKEAEAKGVLIGLKIAEMSLTNPKGDVLKKVKREVEKVRTGCDCGACEGGFAGSADDAFRKVLVIIEKEEA